jgi:glycine C-acetyltransferase/8-amino-7-oxononanoate synthase
MRPAGKALFGAGVTLVVALGLIYPVLATTTITENWKGTTRDLEGKQYATLDGMAYMLTTPRAADYAAIKFLNATVNGRPVTLFCGNDYLGLSQHPEVIEAFQKATKDFGVGAGASRLISGTSELTRELEERLSRFKNKSRALVFSSGYLASLGIVPAFCGKGDLIVMDKLNHASLVDAARLSGTAIRIYPHKDMDYLEKILKQSSRYRRKLIVTDSVFSMDGDLAPLPDIVRLKNQYDACLMIDEAHGTGVFGEGGHGAAEFFGVENEIDISMGTLSKAIGSLGGFVAADETLIEYLVNKSRTFIFSTALPPAVLAASLKALDLIEREPSLRKKLWENVSTLADGLLELGIKPQEISSPIIPIVAGEEERALRFSEDLLSQGFLVPAVRYPAVPKKKARLRVTISAAHQRDEMIRFLKCVKELWQAEGRARQNA